MELGSLEFRYIEKLTLDGRKSVLQVNLTNKRAMVALVRAPEYHMNQEYSSYQTLFNGAKGFEQFW